MHAHKFSGPVMRQLIGSISMDMRFLLTLFVKELLTSVRFTLRMLKCVPLAAVSKIFI